HQINVADVRGLVTDTHPNTFANQGINDRRRVHVGTGNLVATALQHPRKSADPDPADANHVHTCRGFRQSPAHHWLPRSACEIRPKVLTPSGTGRGSGTTGREGASS